MKVLAVSDVHGAYNRLQEIVEGERPFDILVIAGDLTTCGTPDEAEAAIRRVSNPDFATLVVGGNMDPPVLDQTFEDLGVSLNGAGTIIGEVGFFGVSGSPPTPMATPNEIPEEEILARARKGWNEINRARISVFVPHAPPKGTTVDLLRSGKHVGSTGVRTFIEEVHPDVVICGHIHEARGVTSIGESRIVNCGRAGSGFYATIALGEKIDVEIRKSET